MRKTVISYFMKFDSKLAIIENILLIKKTHINKPLTYNVSVSLIIDFEIKKKISD
jgi:hypothetical protein